MAWSPSSFVEETSSPTKIPKGVQTARDTDRAAILAEELRKAREQANSSDPAVRTRANDDIQSLTREFKNSKIPIPGSGSTPSVPRETLAQKTSAEWAPSSFTESTPEAYTEPVAPAAPIPAPEVKPEPSFLDKVGTTIRGYAQGLTSGLVQYPQALAMQAGRNLQGEPDTGTNTFSANLANLREQNQELASTQAPQWYGGQVAGGLNQAVLSGGSTVLGLAGRGAISGGIAGGTANGYTDVGDLAKDVGIGAGVGGAAGALGGAIPKIQATVAKRVMGSELSKGVQTAQTAFDDALTAWKAGNPNSAGLTPAQAVKLAKKIPTIPAGPIPAKVLSGMSKVERDAFMAEVQAARAGVPNPASQALIDAQKAATAAKSNLTKLSGKSPELIKKQAQGLLATQNAANMVEAAPGVGRVIRQGAMGAGAGALVGHPIHGAVGFAANELRQPETLFPLVRTGVGLAKTGALNAPNVGRLGSVAGPLAGNAVPTSAPNAIPNVAPDNRSRLQRLADQTRDQMIGQD